MDSNVSTEIMQKVKAKDVASLCRYDKKDLAEAMLSLYHKYCNAEFRADLINIPLAHIAQEEWKEKFEKKQNEYEELEESRDRIQNDYDDLYDSVEQTLQGYGYDVSARVTDCLAGKLTVKEVFTEAGGSEI